MKILLLNQVFYPDVVSTAQHLSELASALAERGHQVTVIAGRRAYDDLAETFSARENWRGVEILRIFSTRLGKRGKWRRAVDFASFIFSCCTRLLFLPRHDLVVALTTPPLISFIGAWRAKLWRAKFCYWVMDLNPDEAVAAGWLRADSPAGKILEWISRFSLRRADRIIALDHFMCDRIMEKGIAGKKIVVIPPWSHDGEVRFDPAGREQFRAAYRLQDKFVVMYSGNHSPVHPLDTLMQAAGQLKDDSSICFCFVGGGSEFKRVRRWAEDGKQANVLCLPYQPLNQLSASLSAADVHVVVMGDAFVGLVHPCKIYNILAVAAPVLYVGPQPSHVTEILEDVGDNCLSACVRHDESSLLARHILDLKRRTGAGSQRTSKVITTPFQQDILLPKLVAVLEGTQNKEN